MFRFSLLAGLTLVIAALNPGAALAQNRWTLPDPERGVAIMSPIDSPDPCPAYVGGRVQSVPYYPGYCPGYNCPPYAPSYVYRASRPDPALSGRDFARLPRSDYGPFTGARKDEANLLRLGGMNLPHQRSNAPDLVDALERKR